MSQLKNKERDVLVTLKAMDESTHLYEILKKLEDDANELANVSSSAKLSALVEDRKSRVGLLLKRQDALNAIVTNTCNIARKDLEKSSVKSIADMKKSSSYGDYLSQIAQMCQNAKSIVETFCNKMEGQSSVIQSHAQAWRNIIHELLVTQEFITKTALPELKRRKAWEFKVENFKSSYQEMLYSELSTRTAFNDSFKNRNNVDRIPKCFINLLQKTKASSPAIARSSWSEVKDRAMKTPAQMAKHYASDSKPLMLSVIKKRFTDLSADLAKKQAEFGVGFAEKQKIDQERNNIIQEIANNATATEEFGKKIDLEKAEVEQLREEIERLTSSIQNQEVLLADAQKEKESTENRIAIEGEKFIIVEQDIMLKIKRENAELKASSEALEKKQAELKKLNNECIELQKFVPEYEELLKENTIKEIEYQQLDAEISRLKDINEMLKKDGARKEISKN